MMEIEFKKFQNNTSTVMEDLSTFFHGAAVRPVYCVDPLY